MNRFLLRFFLVIVTITAFAIIFLGYFGLETDRFNSLIKNKSNKINQHTKLDFSKTKIFLNLRDLNILMKLKDPKILINNNEIKSEIQEIKEMILNIHFQKVNISQGNIREVIKDNDMSYIN